jgi:hypothetical protein
MFIVDEGRNDHGCMMQLDLVFSGDGHFVQLCGYVVIIIMCWECAGWLCII